jgi:hypothetical protein
LGIPLRKFRRATVYAEHLYSGATRNQKEIKVVASDFAQRGISVNGDITTALDQLFAGETGQHDLGPGTPKQVDRSKGLDFLKSRSQQTKYAF